MDKAKLFLDHLKKDIEEKTKFLTNVKNGESSLEEEPFIRKWYKTFEEDL